MKQRMIGALLVILSFGGTAYAGGVTNIKEVVNRSSKTVRLATYEVSPYEQLRWKKTIPLPGGGVTSWFGNMWIPWADNGEQFSEHFLQILIFHPRPREGLMPSISSTSIKAVTMFVHSLASPIAHA
jgi:hypothetical protein